MKSLRSIVKLDVGGKCFLSFNSIRFTRFLITINNKDICCRALFWVVWCGLMILWRIDSARSQSLTGPFCIRAQQLLFGNLFSQHDDECYDTVLIVQHRILLSSYEQHLYLKRGKRSLVWDIYIILGKCLYYPILFIFNVAFDLEWWMNSLNIQI